MEQNDDLPFGFMAQLRLSEFGTRGDVRTFFSVIFQLIERGILEDSYPTISVDLYRKCIHEGNIEEFEPQIRDLYKNYKNIKTDQVDWSNLPYNRVMGEKPHEKLLYDLTLPFLSDVFAKYFKRMLSYAEYYPVALKEGYKFSTMYVSPTDIILSRKYRKMTPEQFEAQADDPFWMREPFLAGGEENVATLFVDASKK